ERRFFERAPPFAGLETRDPDAVLALERTDDVGDLRDPVDSLVPHIPHNAQTARRPEHTMDLLERFGVTEPVERLSNDHGRSVAIFEGHRFRSPVERARTRKRFRQ